MRFSSQRNFEHANRINQDPQVDGFLGKAIYKGKKVGIISYNSGKSGKDWVFKFLDNNGDSYGEEFKCHKYELSNIRIKPKRKKTVYEEEI